jgi:hypothetical protein
MTDTYWSSHFERELYELNWHGLSGSADLWRVVLNLLPTIEAQHRVFGRVDGTIRVARQAEGALAFEEWAVDADPASLRRRLGAVADVPEPIELSQRCTPALWLPDDHVQIIDYDDADFAVIGNANLAPESRDLQADPRLKLWRVVETPVKLLTLEVIFDLDDSAAGMLLQIISRCDLWCDTRLDGEPGAAHNMANAGLLEHAVEAVALATKAGILRRPS